MTISRRSVLLQGCAIGAGIIAANVRGIVALAQAAPKLRRSLTGMPLNDPIISAWRDAVGQLKAAAGSAPISWTSFANIHGNTARFNRCPHRNWYFLPWHRGFLVMYERVVRQLTGFNDFALPYWDWTSDPRLPRAFVERTFNGRPNPLFEPSREMGPTDSILAENVGQPVIDQILSETPFETFGTSRPQGQNSLDPVWIGRSGIQGTLEDNPHNNVHGQVGGLMGGPPSANDPIFMMHHCNIDRIWWVWNAAGNANSADNLWRDMPFQNHFFNPDGTPYSPKVSDLFVPESLGYTYDLGGVSIAPSAAAPAPLEDKLTTLYSAPALTAAPTAGIAVFTAEAKEAASANRPLDVAVKVGSGPLGAIVRAQRPSAGVAVLDARSVRAQIAAGPRVLCFIRDIAVTKDQGTQFRVFVDCDYLSASVPINDPHYAGTFGFFGPHAHGNGHPTVAVDLTRALQRIHGSKPTLPEQIRVQILPIARGKKKPGGLGTAKPSRVELAFVSP